MGLFIKQWRGGLTADLTRYYTKLGVSC